MAARGRGHAGAVVHEGNSSWRPRFLAVAVDNDDCLGVEAVGVESGDDATCCDRLLREWRHNRLTWVVVVYDAVVVTAAVVAVHFVPFPNCIWLPLETLDWAVAESLPLSSC